MTEYKMTGETPEVRSYKRKQREEREREQIRKKTEKRDKKRKGRKERKGRTKCPYDVPKMLLAEMLKTIDIAEMLKI